jgi:hypothetical protein
LGNSNDIDENKKTNKSYDGSLEFSDTNETNFEAALDKIDQFVEASPGIQFRVFHFCYLFDQTLFAPGNI